MTDAESDDRSSPDLDGAFLSSGRARCHSSACSPAAQPQAEGSARPPHADLLLDRIQLGVELVLPVEAGAGAARFCAAIVRSGLLARTPSACALRQGSRQAIGPRPVPLDGGGVADLGGRLNLAVSGGGQLVVRASSHLLPDVMRALRSRLVAPLDPAPGGADNLAVPYEPGECRALLAWQLSAVAAVVNSFVGDLAAAAGAQRDRLLGRIWVQHAEFCRDYPCEGAEDYVRDLQPRPIPGARHRRERSFRDRRGNGLCLSWDEGTKHSPERKVYAKRGDLIRVEISLRSRGAVTKLLGGARHDGAPTLRGEDVAGALAHLARAAEPLLDETVGLVGKSQVPEQRTGAGFVRALAPLLHLTDPPPRAPGAAGRRPGPGVAGLADQVLGRLIDEGMFDMRGRNSSDAVLRALKAMEAAGALCATPRQPRLFTVAPAFEAARRALAGARQQPAGGATD